MNELNTNLWKLDICKLLTKILDKTTWGKKYVVVNYDGIRTYLMLSDINIKNNTIDIYVNTEINKDEVTKTDYTWTTLVLKSSYTDNEQKIFNNIIANAVERNLREVASGFIALYDEKIDLINDLQRFQKNDIENSARSSEKYEIISSNFNNGESEELLEAWINSLVWEDETMNELSDMERKTKEYLGNHLVLPAIRNFYTNIGKDVLELNEIEDGYDLPTKFAPISTRRYAEMLNRLEELREELEA